MSAVLRSLVFYAIFYGGTALLVVLAMILLLAGGRGLQWVAIWWGALHRACLRHILGITVREEGERPAGPAFYAIKHESFFEALELPNYLELPVVFAKAELFRLPGWGSAARRYGVVPVERSRGASTLRKMVTAAKPLAASGRPLAIFPEGTRVPHGTRPGLRSGFAGLYKMLGLPVVPVAVNSGPLYHRLWKKRGTITLRFGAPIPPGLPRAEIEARVHAAINALND